MEDKKVILVLNNIRSRFNVGAIFRTADAAGVKKIYLCGITPSPPHPKIDKISLGAEKNIPFKKVYSTARVINILKKDGYQVVALEQSKKSINYTKLKKSENMAIIVGNEIKGIHKNILNKCNQTIYIPMRGKKESLNVAIALGIALFDIIHH